MSSERLIRSRRRVRSVIRMTSPADKTPRTPPTHKRWELVALGVTFAGVALVFSLTMENPTIGLPFLVLGIVFFFMGLSAEKPTSSHSGSNDESPTDR